MTSYSPIAIIGIACYYPEARNPLQLWENILARRRQFRRFPDQRLPPDEYHDSDKSAPDKTYGVKGAFIDGFEFDWAARRIPFSTYRSADIAHWLALETALEAIADAGFTIDDIPGEETAVLIGNSLTGEQTRANTMRLRWPYVKRALHAAASTKGISSKQVLTLESALENHYKSAFPPVNEDSLAGGLSNTIAGRICNFLNLHGGGYTVDGACSSSLLAVATAAEGLANNKMNLALAGGVDISLDPFELVGFAKTGALTPDDMNVYDRRGRGFIPGEGCGFVVMKRLEDAQRDKNTIYATLNGWGISSDGGGTGLTAPSAKGQARALQRAYSSLPYTPQDLAFIEGHGTGTTVGDQVELRAVSYAMAEPELAADQERICGMTSIKSIIGHTKAASGMAGFLKTVMAVNRRIMPPTAACRDPHPIFDTEAIHLFPARQGEMYNPDKPIKAGVSSMGFGGINCHMTLESSGPPNPGFAPILSERQLLVSSQDTELFTLTAESTVDLEHKIDSLLLTVKGVSIAELTDLAKKLSQELNAKAKVKGAFIAASPAELLERLAELKEMVLAANSPVSLAKNSSSTVWFSSGNKNPRIGFLFPGQGAQNLEMAKILVERFSWAQEMLADADEIQKAHNLPLLSDIIYCPTYRAKNQETIDLWEQTLARTSNAQPAICFASMLWYRFLLFLGVSPAAVGGHSLGELTAFYAAGILDEKELLTIAAIRGKAMLAPEDTAGAMVSLRCSKETALEILEQVDGYIVLANINSPTQMILSGEKNSIESVINIAREAEIKTYKLNVSNAFHSKLAGTAAAVLAREAILNRSAGSKNVSLFSSSTGAKIDTEVDLNTHFSEQVLSQVDFVNMISAMNEHCDVFIEVGPGRILSGLVQEINKDEDMHCLPVESVPFKDFDLNSCLGELFVRGVDIQWNQLYEGRLTRPFVPVAEKLFIENPCEASFDVAVPTERTGMPSETEGFGQFLADITDIPAEQIAAYLTARGPFLAQVIQADLKYTIPADALPVAFSRWPDIEETLPELSLPASEPDGSKEDSLYNLIQDSTGFPRESLNSDSRLLDDLNLDSIKAGDLIAKFADICGVSGQVDPMTLGNATIGEIVAAVDSIAGSEAHVDVAALNFESSLISLICEQTGFPEKSITLEMRLLDDLNLDSIKAGDLIAKFADICGVAGEIEPLTMANATLTEIIAACSASVTSQPESVSQPGEVDTLHTVIAETARLTGFPEDSLDPDLQIAKDLRISEEMLFTLLRRLSVLFQVETNVDLEPIRQRSLRDMALVFKRIIATKAAHIQEAQQLSETWVRDFAVHMLTESLVDVQSSFGNREEDNWHKVVSLILYDPETVGLAQALKEGMYRQGAKVTMQTFDEAENSGIAKKSKFTQLLSILPPETPAGSSLEHVVKRLAAIASPPPASEAPRRRTTISYVQFGGGRLGLDAKFADYHKCAASALAASIHHERDDLRVRVLDYSATLAFEQIAESVVAEIVTPAAFAVVGFDHNMTRRVPRVKQLQPALYAKRSINWSTDDVIVVTGGAKGITASCALKVARETGVRMALLGSSPLPEQGQHAKSNEIVRILKKYEDMGLEANYFSCDVTDLASVTATIGEINEQMGSISGVIHGAGLNVPRLASQTATPDAIKEVSPKIQGILNLLKVLSPQKPKFIVGLTSIIGVTGMPGNSWYGFSNEVLSLILRQYQEQNPHTKTLSVAYSIWGEEGMGARLGSVEALAQKGIEAIPSQEGIDRFVRLFYRDPGHHQVIVTARLAGLDTWDPVALPTPTDCRYLETLLLHTPGVESIFQAHLELQTDPYLRDHLFNGSYLLPTVFGLEAMAQVACHASGNRDFSRVSITDISLQKPITIDPESGNDIIVRAEVLEQQDSTGRLLIKAGIAKSHTGIKGDYFSATFEIGLDDHEDDVRIDTPSTPLFIEPVPDLYRKSLLFQGPLFQRIKRVYGIEKAGERAESASFETSMTAKKISARDAFSSSNDTLILPDPFFRDSLLQSATLLVPRDTSLPVGIDRIDIFPCDEEMSRSVTAQVVLQEYGTTELETSVVAVDASGRVIEKLTGYNLKVLQHHDEYPTAADLIAPDTRDQMLLSDAVATLRENYTIPELSIEYICGIHGLAQKERRVATLPLLTRVAKSAMERFAETDETVDIDWLESGKPVILASATKDIAISLSHDDRLCLVTAGVGPTGCDITPISPRNKTEWQGLLGDKNHALQEALMDDGTTMNNAGSKIWACLETAQKALGSNEFQLTIDQKIDIWTIFKVSAGEIDILIAAGGVDLTWRPKRIFAFSICAAEEHSYVQQRTRADDYKDIMSMSHVELQEKAGPHGQDVFVQRIPVTFRPAAQLGKGIYFSNFFFWAGEVREIAIWPILKKIGDQMNTGKWGSVTNYSQLKIFAEATTHDRLEIRMWPTGNGGPADSTMDLHFDFSTIQADNSTSLLASLEIQVTWVEILDRGIVSPREYPEYYRQFMENLLPKSGEDVRHEQEAFVENPLALVVNEEQMLYQAQPGTVIEPVLCHRIIDTSLDNGNLVGNIYFANYYAWQGQTRDHFFYDLCPECFKGTGADGELVCLETRVDHLREAMPFDQIKVTMALKSLTASSAVFYFEYFKISKDTKPKKLAFGEHKAVWVIKDANSRPRPSPFPAVIGEAFQQAIGK